jgi:hypothetical protein
MIDYYLGIAYWAVTILIVLNAWCLLGWSLYLMLGVDPDQGDSATDTLARLIMWPIVIVNMAVRALLGKS